MKLLFAKGISAVGGLLALVTVLVSGCATSSEPVFTSDPAFDVAAQPGTPAREFHAQGTNDLEVRFQKGDVVIITFSGTPDPLQNHEERIKEDGTITLPLIGAVKAEGKLAGELQNAIHDLYVPKYYVRLTVTVKPLYVDQLFSVLGEVRIPGQKPYAPGTTVTKAIGAAGGFTDFANKKSVMLIRSNGQKIKVNYNDAIKDPRKDPQVFPRDSISVEKRGLF